MSTEVDTVITRFETEASSAVADLAALKKAQDSARESVERLPKAGKAADDSVRSLGERMKAFSREERAEGRTAAFFVGQLEAIAPAGSVASSVLGELTQALVGGVGLGLAFGAVSIGLKLFTGYLEEEEKAAKAASEAAVKWSKELHQETVSFLDDTTKSIESMRGATAAMQTMRLGIVPLQEKEKLVTMQLAEATERRADAEAKLQAARGKGQIGLYGQLAADIRRASEQIGVLQPQLDRLHDSITQRTAAAARLVDEEQAKAAREKAQAEALDLAKNLASVTAGVGLWGEALFDAWSAGWQLREKNITDAQKASADASAAFLKMKAAQVGGFLDQAFEHARFGFDQVPLPIVPKLTEAEVAAARLGIAMRKVEKDVSDSLEDMGKSAVQSLAGDVARSFGVVARSSAAYDRALRASGQAAKGSADLSAAAFAAFTQNALASMAEQAMAKALFETAEGLASLWLNPAMAATHFEAAAAYGAAAALAGGSAYGIGQTRGMTRSERDSLASFESGSSAGSSGASGGSTGATSGAAGTVHTREIVVVVGDPFETPQEAARRAARRLGLAVELNMMPRSA